MTAPFARTCLAAAFTALGAPWALAQATAELDTITVHGNYNNAVGTSDAASQGVVTAKLLESRPTLRPAEVLEFVPGVIVTQHSGDGKANQYFLRGFNLDHGTDFATFVDGMPVNMPTHAHGQGYSDLNWLIPELVERLNYRKGPYAAEDGDFASAGSARLRLFDSLPRGIASLTVGENNYRRALVANSTALTTGQLLYALEGAQNDGPWEHPEKFHRLNGVLRYSLAQGDTKSSLTAMAYAAHWNSSDQVPQSAVDSGQIGRFGTLDPSDRGRTRRFSLSYDLLHSMDDGDFKLNAYAIQSQLELVSNFTYFLDNPVDGDQHAQAEHRKVVGLNTSRSWNTTLAGHDSTHTVGLQVRHDRLGPVGLYAAQDGQRLDTNTRESTVRQTSLALYAENTTRWTPWFKSVAGLRADQLHVDVGRTTNISAGDKTASLGSPKLSLVFGPWAKTEYFVNHGQGFHSNDARGIVSAVDPAPALVRSKGVELGVRSELIPGLQTSLALWQLNLGSELMFVGDAGVTEPTGASQRHGIELNNHYVATPWLLFDLDIAASQARFKDVQGDAPNAGRYIPGSVNTVASFGATITELGPWFGQFQWRYFGPRALIEDNSQRSKSTLLAYTRAGYKISRDLKLSLDVFNLFDRQASDIDYYYESRVSPTADASSQVHFHPVEPRTFRLTLSANF
ncbi:TonB-dependent receptor [Aquabacterium sp.]|uniref:TonB-dependent receptor n=1 Tax=Aquabacterium sp. TaxID=1872578 RepID=UPI003D6D893C